jgi:DNA-binding transcriptional MerR regulator
MIATVEDALDRLRRQDAAVPEADATLTIGEMAESTGITAHTMRYYERIGLLDVARDAAGHRVYSTGDFNRVVFLNRLRMTGMPIREVQGYGRLVAGGEPTVPERLQMLQAHREAVRAQLQELQFALETVEFKIAAYGGHCQP